MNGRFEAIGKQVLLDGKHYADARDVDAAHAIACALNDFDFRYLEIPCEICETVGGHVATCERGRADGQRGLFRKKPVRKSG